MNQRVIAYNGRMKIKNKLVLSAAARQSSARPADAPPVNTTAAALARVKRGRR
jgi:hypothetical protein